MFLFNDRMENRIRFLIHPPRIGGHPILVGHVRTKAQNVLLQGHTIIYIYKEENLSVCPFVCSLYVSA